MTNTPGKLTILLLSLLGCIFFATASTLAESMPAEITISELADLYTPVVFDHLTHSESYECNRCHHDSKNEEKNCSTCHAGRPVGGKQQCSTCHSVDSYEPEKNSKNNKTYLYHIDTPALKGSWHLLCRSCHIEDDGPVECQDCHALTTKGLKFFRLTK